MRWVRFSLLAAVLAVATVRAPAAVVASGLLPVLLLVPALLLGFTSPPGTAALCGWLLGLLLDLLSLEPLGFHAFLFGAAACALSRSRGAVFAEHPVARGVLAAAASLLVLLVMLVRVELAEPAFAATAHLPAVLLGALTTGAAVPLLGAADRRLKLLSGLSGGGSRVRA